jgi:nucleotide-binding universal stress UspA family protein
VTADTDDREAGHPVLLCFDGSDDAATAIAQAAELLAARRAVVLTVWEPVATWEPYDPATILSAPLSKLLSRALGVDEIAAELAEEKVKQGVALATGAGLEAQGRVARGKTWRTICDVAGEIDAATIVLGARGLSRMGSLLLGSVSSAVLVHAKRPVLVVPHHGDG